MDQKLIHALTQLPPTGSNGFEGLIAKLLEVLTGQHFRLAQAGTQLGRDMSSNSINSNIIAVECKLYSKSTKLDERELLGELVQVAKAIPDLDLWVLVTSRDIPSQLDEALRSTAGDYSITYLSISTDDGVPSSLELLCTQAIDLVIDYLEAESTKSSIQNSLEGIATSAQFSRKIEDLRRKLVSPLIGYDSWRTVHNHYLLQCLQSETESRAFFGQLINVEDESINLVKRKSIQTRLDDWLNKWINERRPFVILGEEGDGKTWGVASWLADKIKDNKDFPPILFLSSINVNSNEPELLLSEVISRHLPSLKQEQRQKRINRWINRKTNNFPLFLLVLDGINERRNYQWWRTLLEKLVGQPWLNQVAVLITCRSAYWQRNFEAIYNLRATTYTLPPYSDSELSEALAHYNLEHLANRSDLRSLICKPRYFDLMVQHHQRVEETGDVTVARLIYEDWRDRLQRKTNILLDDESFQSFIRQVARKYQKGSKYIQEQEIGSALALSVDQQAVLEELRTGGILQSNRGRYQVNEQFLIYGFALLLVDELEEATGHQAKDLNDVLAEWLEPQLGMDIKATICGFAALYALHLRNYPREAKITLLSTWVNSHNPEQTAENDFISYLPIEPLCYVKLAEIVWSDSNENAWAQELLMQSFLRWGTSQSVLPQLVSAFEAWLGFIHIDGFSWQRSNATEAGKEVRQQISDRIGYPLQTGEITFGDYTFTVIEDDGLLRLGRVALAVISHLPRGNFMRAIATGCLAEAIMGGPYKYDLFAWLFRTTSESVWTEVEAEVNCLLSITHVVTQQAAHRLLSFEGSQEAYVLQQTLPRDLFPLNPISELHSQDPCTSIFQWTQADCEECLNRVDLSPEQIANQLKKYCANPCLSVPNDLGQRIESLATTISIQQVKTSLLYTRDDWTLDDYEPVLCAYAPSVMAALVQRIIRQVDERQGLALRQVSWGLKENALILRLEEEDSIYRAWNRLLDAADSWSEAEEVAEMLLFELILQTKSAEEQIFHLLQRPEKATDLIDYEKNFLPLNNWEIVYEHLVSVSTVKTVKRILWFISSHIENLPKEILYEQVIPFLEHEDDVVRLCVLQILYFSGDIEAIKIVINTGWTWDKNKNEIENHWGSLLLSKWATFIEYSELCHQVHPIYLGYAIQCRGILKNEIDQYAQHIQRIWSGLNTETANLLLDCPPITIRAGVSDGENIVTSYWRTLSKSTSSQSVTFLVRDASWGGIDKGDPQDWKEMMSPNQERRKTQLQIMRETIQQQVEAGNIWFAQRFFPHALEQVLKEYPSLVDQWLEAVFNDDSKSKQYLLLASSFYEALCTILLKNNPNKGIHLYWKLQKAKPRVRIEDKYSEIELLDYALFRSSPVKPIEGAWKEKIEQCKTDKELLKIAILAQSDNARNWLWSYIKQGLNSKAAINKSRAITLMAFVQEQEAFELLSSLEEEQPNTWVKDLLTTSRQRWQTNNWAMHWFRCFLTAKDDVKSWASFKLFLHCVDNRFWQWWKQIEVEELVVKTVDTSTEKRYRFLENNLYTIKNKIQKNEKSLEKYYLGHKVLDGQAYPWM